MKKEISLIMLLLPFCLASQIPVTDGATNASIGVVNNQLLKTNMQLKVVNQNLNRLIRLMEKNNDNNQKSKNILEEELQVQKNAPIYVLKSNDVQLTLNLKNKIIRAYQNSKNIVTKLKYLEKKEVEQFASITGDAIKETADLFKQCNDILKTDAIIRPEERLKKIGQINVRLKEILDSISKYGNELSDIEAVRKARLSLIQMNKVQ